MTAKAMKNTAELKFLFYPTTAKYIKYMSVGRFGWEEKKKERKAICRPHIIYIIVQIETCFWSVIH